MIYMRIHMYVNNLIIVVPFNARGINYQLFIFLTVVNNACSALTQYLRFEDGSR